MLMIGDALVRLGASRRGSRQGVTWSGNVPNGQHHAGHPYRSCRSALRRAHPIRRREGPWRIVVPRGFGAMSSRGMQNRGIVRGQRASHRAWRPCEHSPRGAIRL